MTYKELTQGVRDAFKEFDSFLESVGMEKLSAYLSNDFEVMNQPLTMAVYPSSPKGETYSDSDGRASFTIDLFVNDTANSESLALLEYYYSALITFVHGLFLDGNPVTIETSTLVRMDDGEIANAILMLISVKMNDLSDMGWV